MIRIRRGTPQRELGRSNSSPSRLEPRPRWQLLGAYLEILWSVTRRKILARGVVGQLSQVTRRVSNAGRAAAWALFSHAPSPPPRSQSSTPGPSGMGSLSSSLLPMQHASWVHPSMRVSSTFTGAAGSTVSNSYALLVSLTASFHLPRGRFITYHLGCAAHRGLPIDLLMLPPSAVGTNA